MPLLAAAILVYLMPVVAGVDAALHPRSAWRQAGVPRWPFLVLPVAVALALVIESPARVALVVGADVGAAVYFAKVRAIVDVATGMLGRAVGIAGIQSGAYSRYMPAIVGVPIVACVAGLVAVTASTVYLRVVAIAAGTLIGAVLCAACAVWGRDGESA